MLLDELQRVIRKIIGREPVAADELAVVLQRRAEIVAPVAGAKAVVFVKAAVVGMIGRLQTVVPFAKRPGRIAGGFERLSDRDLIEVQSLLPGRNAAYAAAGVVAPCKELGSRRRADRTYEEPLEQRPVLCERVDVG